MDVLGNKISLGKMFEGVVQQINPGTGGIEIGVCVLSHDDKERVKSSTDVSESFSS